MQIVFILFIFRSHYHTQELPHTSVTTHNRSKGKTITGKGDSKPLTNIIARYGSTSTKLLCKFKT